MVLFKRVQFLKYHIRNNRQGDEASDGGGEDGAEGVVAFFAGGLGKHGDGDHGWQTGDEGDGVGHVGVGDKLADNGEEKDWEKDHLDDDAEVELFLAQDGCPVAEAEQAAHVDEGKRGGGAADFQKAVFKDVGDVEVAEQQQNGHHNAADGRIDEVFPVKMAFAPRRGEIEAVGPEKALVNDADEGAVDAAMGRADTEHQRQADEADVAENKDGLENVCPLLWQAQQARDDGEDDDEGPVNGRNHEKCRQISGELGTAGAVHHVGKDHNRQKQLHDEGCQAVEKLAGGDAFLCGDVADKHHQKEGNELFKNDHKRIHTQSTYR